jgi:hypothetical protein
MQLVVDLNQFAHPSANDMSISVRAPALRCGVGNRDTGIEPPGQRRLCCAVQLRRFARGSARQGCRASGPDTGCSLEAAGSGPGRGA